VNEIVDFHYKAKDWRNLTYGHHYHREIQFGTFKWDPKKKVKENYTLSAEDIQAHKVCWKNDICPQVYVLKHLWLKWE
jgi:hypothetical protein